MLNIVYQEKLQGKRKYNQDALLIKCFDNGDKLLAVADGMGGGVLGAELAQRAMDELDTIFYAPVRFPHGDLRDAVCKINTVLKEMLYVYDIKTRKESEIQKGGTTLCVTYYSEKKKKITYLNIGDSRISICGKKELKSLSVDQNKYEEAKLKGEIAEEKNRRFVKIVLGISTNREIDEVLDNEQWAATGQHVLTDTEDTIILSTDGFHDYIKEENFCIDLHRDFPTLLDKVKKESSDNITVIVAKVTSC